MSILQTASIDRWSSMIHETSAGRPSPAGPFPIAVLEGEGIGPEVLSAALEVLEALDEERRSRFRIHLLEAPESAEEVAVACGSLFAEGGAMLAGPMGGRFVYDLRRRLDLFCKLSPIIPWPELRGARRLHGGHMDDVDLLVVRENSEGIYQGHSMEEACPEQGCVVRHSFTCTERAVRRVMVVAARIAARRRGRVAVVVKRGGLPVLSRLWTDCAVEVAAEEGIDWKLLDVDYAVYHLVQHPEESDVVVASNLFGDILSDLGGVLIGSRGMTYGGSFGSSSGGVYQTNHGAAHELTGTDRANPGGQILALAMLLRESFGLMDEAALIESALRRVWAAGWRTADLVEKGCRLVGTREFARLAAEAVVELRQADRKR